MAKIVEVELIPPKGSGRKPVTIEPLARTAVDSKSVISESVVIGIAISDDRNRELCVFGKLGGPFRAGEPFLETVLVTGELPLGVRVGSEFIVSSSQKRSPSIMTYDFGSSIGIEATLPKESSMTLKGLRTNPELIKEGEAVGEITPGTYTVRIRNVFGQKRR